LEERLSYQLGLKVSITSRGKAGTVSIDYQTFDQLDEVLHRLQGG
jgi:ParB family chromosome partitioning protein